ncbi:MAG: replicative DNA helicase [Christensenellales bacterium]|jgi:replicative DNA helicase
MNDKRIPPHHTEAEQSVLGSMLLSQACVAAAAEVLSPEDFYSPAHREMFDAMLLLYQTGKAVDLVTLADELDRRNTIGQVGGLDYLTTLSRFVPSTANIDQYIKIVEERSTLRKLISAGNDIARESYEAERPIEQILGAAEKRVFDIAMGSNSDSLQHIHQALANSIGEITAAMNNQGAVTGLSTGFSQLDSMTAGLHPSQLIVIAGRPGMGKTSFAMNLAHHASLKQNRPVAVFSLEMSREQLATRLLCSQALVDMQKVRAGQLDAEEMTELARAMQALSLSPLYVDDTPGIGVLEIRSKCRRLKIDKGLGLVVIDYLQLMQGSSRADSRQQEVSEMTRQLKNMARELDVPILLLSQLSRASEQRKREERRPILSDLRESGAIEQDADVVMFVYRENPVDDEEIGNSDHAEIILAKQRSGPTGIIKLAWLGQYTRFAELDNYHGEAPPF